MVKILMSWDIKPGSESEYFEFIVREFAPGIMKLGVQPTEAWYTVFGEGPQILTGCVAEDLSTMQSVLSSHDWQKLQKKLFEYVTNFNFKIVRATSRFQLL
ncbi:MAG: hypothetical protein Fur0044_08150 [Anaerolineae bacterium]|nr:hypothetical protein [Anaerolineales bacterium]MCQ3974857.1 hypothetical protein [Anaerolineae bacterium]